MSKYKDLGVKEFIVCLIAAIFTIVMVTEEITTWFY